MVLTESQLKPKHWIAPDFHLLGVDGKHYTLDNFKDKKGLAVIFTCNHCPYAIASRPILVHLSELYINIGFIAISSNDVNFVPKDGYIYMQQLARQLELCFPYVYDESQDTAKAYDAQCTPDNFLFSNNGGTFELFFHGRFNNNRKNPTQATSNDFEEHIQKLLNNSPPSQDRHPSIGCSIKWK